MSYFRDAEFACKCGNCAADGSGLHVTLRGALETIRGRLGAPMVVTSGCRCYEWNKAVGGSVRSFHLPMHGFRAADIACTNPYDRRIIVKEALNLGLTVGVSKDFLHIDCRMAQIVFAY